ncbi:MAG: cupredoxin domain-containing protein [Acidobacteriota bacterium]|nr:cupredoxin domain-containing protein [Acidobacteriota bacterium]
MLLAGLTTAHKIELAVVALVFITFALTSSFLLSRRRPDFPGRNGMAPFVIASVFLFASMITAVIVFGRESEAKGAGAPAKAPGVTVQVQEVEFKITLSTSQVPHGTVTFVVKNAGKIVHNLTIQQGGEHTANLSAGSTANLTVTLKKGSYTLYCSIPGHRQLGMVAKLTVT